MNIKKRIEKIQSRVYSFCYDYLGLKYFRKIALTDVISFTGSQQLTGLLPLIGYALVIVSVGDFLYILYPPQFQNPTWELNAIGSLIENSWALLIGFGFIFSRYFTGNAEYIWFLEIFILRVIRWVILIMAIGFIFLIPLVVLNTNRLIDSSKEEITKQLATQLNQIKNVDSQLDQVSDINQIIALGKSLGLNTDDFPTIPKAQIKTQIRERLTTFKSNVEQQSVNIQKQQSRNILKNSAKILFSGIIMCSIFIIIWLVIGRVYI